MSFYILINLTEKISLNILKKIHLIRMKEIRKKTFLKFFVFLSYKLF